DIVCAIIFDNALASACGSALVGWAGVAELARGVDPRRLLSPGGAPRTVAIPGAAGLAAGDVPVLPRRSRTHRPTHESRAFPLVDVSSRQGGVPPGLNRPDPPDRLRALARLGAADARAKPVLAWRGRGGRGVLLPAHVRGDVGCGGRGATVCGRRC